MKQTLFALAAAMFLAPAAQAIQTPLNADDNTGDTTQPEIPWTITPAPGTEVESLTAVSFAWDADVYMSVACDPTNVVVYKDGQEFTTVTGSEEYNPLTLTLETAATEPGEYTMTFPARSIDYMTNDFKYTAVKEPVSYSWTVTGPKVEPAVYDLTPASFTPAAGDCQSLAKITLTFDETVAVNSGERAVLSDAAGDFFERLLFAVSAEDDKTVEAVPEQAPSVDTDYRLTVPAGAIGTPEFISSEGVTGRANPEIILDWSLSGVSIVNTESEGNALYFNLQGQRINAPETGSMVIKVQNGRATKLIVK